MERHLINDLRPALLYSAFSVVAIQSALFFGLEQFKVKLLGWVDAGAVNTCAEKRVVAAGVLYAVDFDDALSEGQPVLRGEGALLDVAN